MAIAPLPEVTVTPVAYFPQKYFLENLVVRADGSLLITAMLQQELWYVAGSTRALTGPVLVHSFEHPVTGIVEVEPDVFVLSLLEGCEAHFSHLVRLDMRGWNPGSLVDPEIIYTFEDERVRTLNGSCLLGPGVLAVADCFAGLIWRVDLTPGARSASARVWLEHDTMADDPESAIAWSSQPGIKGLRYGARGGYLYYTSTAQKVFMRVLVDADTLEPADGPEFVAALDGGDDFCIDEKAGFAYVARHHGNTLDRVPLAPRHGSTVRHLVGDPFDPMIVGPSSACWGRGADDDGRLMYVATDGGTTAPPAGGVRNASVLRVELRESAAP